MSHPEQTDTQAPNDAQHGTWHRSGAIHWVTRLSPGTDLKRALQEAVAAHGIKAATLSSCVGSLSVAHLRLASAQKTQSFDGPFEIVSLVGTLCRDGVHLHISLADAQGQVIGGHLLEGNIIHTTAEISLTLYEDINFSRPHDAETGYGELAIEKC